MQMMVKNQRRCGRVVLKPLTSNQLAKTNTRLKAYSAKSPSGECLYLEERKTMSRIEIIVCSAQLGVSVQGHYES